MQRSWKHTLGSKSHTLVHCNLVFVLNHVWSQMYFFLPLDNFCKNRKIIISSPFIASSDVKTRFSGLSNFIFPYLLHKSTRCFISFSRAQKCPLEYFVVFVPRHAIFPLGCRKLHPRRHNSFSRVYHYSGIFAQLPRWGILLLGLEMVTLRANFRVLWIIFNFTPITTTDVFKTLTFTL